MATDQGWYVAVPFFLIILLDQPPYPLVYTWPPLFLLLSSIGLTGTNARPSIAPTFGVEPMLVRGSPVPFFLVNFQSKHFDHSFTPIPHFY